jgi:hypothetical protein
MPKRIHRPLEGESGDGMNEVPLRQYVERIFDEKDRAHLAELESAERALALATESLTHRLESMNQFRKQLEDERAKYVREERFQMVLDRLRTVEEHDAARAGRQAVVLAMTTIVAALLATVITLLLRHMLP